MKLSQKNDPKNKDAQKKHWTKKSFSISIEVSQNEVNRKVAKWWILFNHFFSLTPTMETVIIQKSIVFFVLFGIIDFEQSEKKTCLNLVNEQDVSSFTLEIVRL